MIRIAVIGAGAIGGAIGGLLQRAGYPVTLIGRAGQVAALQAGGLRLSGAAGDFTIPVAAAERLEFAPDLALLAVKTQDVTAAVRANQEWLAGATVVTLQNGVQSDDLVGALLPREHIVSGVVSTIATYLEPGAITLVAPGSVVLGHPFPVARSLVRDTAAVLRAAVPTLVSDNIRGAHWLKLLVNLSNALPAQTNLPVQEAYADPFLRRLSVGMIREGFRAISRAQIPLEALPEVSLGLLQLVNRLPVGLAGYLTGRQVRRTLVGGPVLGSTLQSLRRQQPTEIDYLNGEIVRLGRTVGVPTPLNSGVVALVHEIARSGRFMTSAEIRAALERGGANAPG